MWGYAPPENFEISRLGNAISSVFQELFVIYAYRKLFTSYTVSANQCTLRVKHLQRQLQKKTRLSLYLETSKCLPFQSHHSKFVVIKLSELP